MGLNSLFDWWLEWGLGVVLAVQGWGDWLTVPMVLLSLTGDAEFYLLILPALYWSVDRRFGLRLALLLLVSIVLNNLLKLALAQPRPFWVDPQVQLLGSGSAAFGLPSGHAQHAVVMWGAMAAWVGRRRAWAVAVAMMLLVGISRVYLGLHFPVDVLLGWTLGGLLLWAALRYGPAAVGRVRDRPVGAQIALLAGLVLPALAVGALATGARTTSLPTAWMENAARWQVTGLGAGSYADLVTACGVFLGMGLGAVWLRTAGEPPMPVGLLRRVLCYLVGAVGVLFIWEGLDALLTPLAPELSPAGYALRLLRYSAVGLWITLGAPLLFRRLRLTG